MTRLLTRGAVAGAMLILLEALYAVLRPSPILAEFDPSVTLGDEYKPRLKVAVLGDSSVTAPGVSGPEDTWVHIIACRLARRYRVELKSFAISGSMTHDLIREQLQPALAMEPDLILLSVGANDAIKGVSLRRFTENLDELVGGLSASGAVVVQSGVGDLGTIPRLYPPLRELMTARSAKFDQAHKKVAARHGTHVVEQRVDSRDLWLKDRDLWAADLFHVSARGHRRWADVAWSTIEPLVPDLHGAR